MARNQKLTHLFKKHNSYITGTGKAIQKIAYQYNEVKKLIQWIEQETTNNKKVFAFFSYESSPIFNPYLKTKKITDFPLAGAVSYQTVKTIKAPKINRKNFYLNLKKSITKKEYKQKFAQCLKHIKEGNFYQINYTFRLSLENFSYNPLSFFFHLEKQHPTPYASFMDFNDFQILSFSPELFLEKKDNIITTEPMKGTYPRAITLKEDKKLKKKFAQDKKIKAENLMIVDLLRNDLAKIATPKTLKVLELFKIHTYPTLHQMTSKIQAQLEKTVTLWDIFHSCFPSGSVTGAPKKRVMECIEKTEKFPRKIYTGGLFFFEKDNFISNVPIRTIIIKNKKLELSVGSGIVADSQENHEWQECLLKTHFLNYKKKFTYLFETILWDKSKFILLENHLNRLKHSCNYFSIPFKKVSIDNALNLFSKKELGKSKVLKLIIGNDGKISFTAKNFSPWDKTINIILSKSKNDNSNIFLYHKTNVRHQYDKELKLAKKNHFSEIFFINKSEHLCEGAMSNLFIYSKDDQWLTPHWESGLLQGVMRNFLIKKFKARERFISLNDLKFAKKVLICNSVRGEKLVNSISSASGKILWKKN